MGNVYLIVIDGLGVGAQEDAAEYGDSGMNTLGHVSEATRVKLPNLQKFGIGNIISLASIPENKEPLAAYGKLREVSAGKDSTTGHWEISGIQLDRPFPTYPDGFPEEVIQAFCQEIGVEEVLCNKPYSGTDVIRDYGKKHMETGFPIVYTSADSVFQVACHDEVVSVEKLYEWCEIARKKVCVGEHEVGRVIARPFTGNPDKFERISDKRHDYSSIPPDNNVVKQLHESGIITISVGKVADLFAGEGFSGSYPTKSNAQGIAELLSLMSSKLENSFVFVNLIDTDQLFGHRLDPEGFAGSLQEFDKALPAIVSKIREEDLLIITGDHGNDPCSDSTDHSREFVPLLIFPKGAAVQENLGVGDTFSDIAKSVASFFKLSNDFPGKSFIK
ncbi:phosphopentomutase [Gracilimonas amylolytica]|uniref:phosphopentomutase n=1 Tax=Gracilimonas amylolytica TaxID=1749045 RepID=UPI000CD9408E|nr:phosphopentomutase [Gracilimonas amylolytica]